MSFRAIASGRRFAIDGELNAAIGAERAQLASSSSGGAPLATRSLEILKTAVDEFLKTAPHDCDIAVDLWGERDAEGLGGVTLKITITPHETPVEAASGASEEPAPVE
jgi:hypothetical protein